MCGEELIEAGRVGVGEVIAALWEQEPGAEHFRVEDGLHAVRFAALQVPAYEGEACGEPAHDMEQG